MNILQLFQKCVNAEYIHVENSGDYYVERDDSTLYIFLECSNGHEDWENNFDFPAKPYKRMGKTVWFAHRGFLKVWKSIEDHLNPYIMDPEVKKIVTVGYSHGAAMAVLCHEYIWYNRPDLRDNIDGYGFGCPRVFWGIKPKHIKIRWNRFAVIRNIDDIITHLPPALLGYSHVGTVQEIGTEDKYSPVNAHRPENIEFELRKYIFNKQNKEMKK